MKFKICVILLSLFWRVFANVFNELLVRIRVQLILVRQMTYLFVGLCHMPNKPITFHLAHEVDEQSWRVATSIQVDVKAHHVIVIGTLGLSNLHNFVKLPLQILIDVVLVTEFHDFWFDL